MHHEDFLQDLAIVLIAAGLAAVLFRWLRQPVVLGYMLAGIVVGPYLLPIPPIRDKEIVHTLAELGVVMLMFSHGLHFNLRRLVQVGRTALAAALFQMVVIVWAGHAIGRWFGWGAMDSLFLGALLSISSTAIVYKALSEVKRLKAPFAAISFGVLVVEDAVAIGLLALLSGVAMTGAPQVDAVMGTVVRLGMFLTLVPVAGLIVVPRLLRGVGRFQSRELLLITTLALCFGLTLLALRLGYSVALGAFIIGALVSEAREGREIDEIIAPVRNMFTAVFFVATGMLLDPALLLDYAAPVAVIAAATVFIKVVTYSIATALCGHPPRTALSVGLTLAQIGEFSFIIASLGLSLGVVSEFLYPIAVAVSLFTTLTTPYFIQYADGIARVIWRFTPGPFRAAVTVYSRRHPAGAAANPAPHLRRILRRWALQIGLNLVMIATVFFAAHEAGGHAHRLPFEVPAWLGGFPTVVWFACVLLLLPVFVALFRKLQAIAMFAAEAAVGPPVAGGHSRVLHALVANAVLIGSSLLVVLFVGALGSALLPPLPVLAVLGLFAALLMLRLWNHFIRVYGRAQVALEETLAQPHPDDEAVPAAPGLAELRLEAVALPPGCPADGRLIHEIALRGKTGASIVAIARGAEALVNPGPFEELRAGDTLYLLATPAQAAAAAALLAERGG